MYKNSTITDTLSMPYVIEQTSHGERSYDIFSRLLNNYLFLFVY